MSAMAAPESEKPYWDTEAGGIAPIKSSYVLWHKMGKNRTPLASSTVDDDAAEGRGHAQLDKPLLRTADVAPAADSLAPPAAAEPAAATSISATGNQPGEAAEPTVHGTVEEGQAEPEQKKVRLSGAQKKALAKQRQKEQWEAKIAAKKEAKKLAQEEGAADGGEGGRQRGKGQNKNRKFDNRAGEIRLCNQLAQGKPCERPNCKNDHDLAAFFASRPADIRRITPATPDDLTPVESPVTCPVFLSLGACPYGFKCRFGESHMRKVEDGQGFMQSGWELVVDEEKVAKRKAEIGEGKAKRSDRGEMNLMAMTDIKSVRGGGKSQEKFPLSVAYLNSIGEPLDSRERDDNNGRGGKGKKRGRNGDSKPEEAAESSAAAATTAPSGEAGSAEPVASTSAVAMDTDTAAAAEAPKDEAAASAADDAHPSRTFVPDLAPIRASEKKRLDFAGKLWMAPLTTVGNLPFRRLAVEYGCDITTSEMGLAQEFLTGNANEWSLVRRHPSEKIFGVQICGAKPQVLVPAAEAIAKNCEIDFLDVNCGCPIDLVFNKGAGSALLAHATKLGKSLVGMSQVLGEIPLTVKIRTGIANNQPTAHKLMPRFQKEWGVSAVTMHGRSRQQRYKHFADYKYIGECVNVLRETVKDDDLAPIPIFGNGDAYDHRSYWENVEQSGVDGIMIARGALIKPWIFTELKERRDWDISSRERLDMIGRLCNFGLEHWGSDQMGTNLTRRFVCEAMSFTHRYVPVGLLERLPTHMNERAFPYKGRDELETLLASDQAKDWVDITSMFLGPPPDDWTFTPKHKAASTETEAQG